MKTQLSIVFLILLSSGSYGQLIVDAGNDTAICANGWDFDTIEIGGNPTASGGVEPYIYTWSTNYTIGSHSYGASFFLDDSTKSNPKLICPTLDFLKLKLIVTDNLGAKAEDSITIRFSTFYYLTIECIAFIDQGDTVTLSGNVGQGIGPFIYTWAPNYNISDTSSASPQAWPDTSVYYRVYAIDSIGCVSEPSTCSIYVNPTGITQPKNNNLIKSVIFPNPINNYSIIALNENSMEELTLQVINSYGQTVLIDKLSSNIYTIGDKIFIRGFYIYLIKNGSKTVSYGRFVKN
jgi:hypothetical protein